MRKGHTWWPKIIREKALSIKENHNVQIFNASQGWLIFFLRRYGIKSKRIVSEAKSVNPEIVSDWYGKLQLMIANYQPDCIYNADETALSSHCLPKSSYLTPGFSANGCKVSMHLSVLLCCISSGQKLIPVVIGLSKRQRNYLHDSRVLYYANKKAWMMTEIFNQWAKLYDSHFRSIISMYYYYQVGIIIDNCSAHKNATDLK